MRPSARDFGRRDGFPGGGGRQDAGGREPEPAGPRRRVGDLGLGADPRFPGRESVPFVEARDQCPDLGYTTGDGGIDGLVLGLMLLNQSQGVIADPASMDPSLSVLSEREQGTLAEMVAVPTGNLVQLPEGISFEQAACLPTAWVTAHHMLFCQAGLTAGDTVLVQGASGGLAAALVLLATNAGIRVWATSRTPEAASHLLDLGAEMLLEHGSRMPARVDAVLDGVGAATWDHSLKALRAGGTLVAVGGVSGFVGTTDIGRVIRNRLRIVGSLMGCKEDLEAVVELCAQRVVAPPIDEVIGFDDIPRGLGLLAPRRARWGDRRRARIPPGRDVLCRRRADSRGRPPIAGSAHVPARSMTPSAAISRGIAYAGLMPYFCIPET